MAPGGNDYPLHFSDVIMGTMVLQITILTIVYSTIYSCADQRKHQSSKSLALVQGIPRWRPVTRKIFPFDDVIMVGYNPCNMLSVLLTHCGLMTAYGIGRFWSTLLQVVACCLMALSHYLNQCRLTSTRSSAIHSGAIFTGILEISVPQLHLKFIHFKSQPHMPGDNELIIQSRNNLFSSYNKKILC